MHSENARKLEKIKTVINTRSQFTKVKYNGEIYSIGDDVLIADFGNEYLLGKILKIKNTHGIHKYPYWPSMEVQWYYRKSDIEKDSKSIQGLNIKSISDYEVFTSNHKDVIFIETIVGRCNVLGFEEYEKLEDINPNIYFNRAFYDPVKVIFFKNKDSNLLL